MEDFSWVRKGLSFLKEGHGIRVASNNVCTIAFRLGLLKAENQSLESHLESDLGYIYLTVLPLSVILWGGEQAISSSNVTECGGGMWVASKQQGYGHRYVEFGAMNVTCHYHGPTDAFSTLSCSAICGANWCNVSQVASMYTVPPFLNVRVSRLFNLILV
jgi:hypothetical protein